MSRARCVILGGILALAACAGASGPRGHGAEERTARSQDALRPFYLEERRSEDRRSFAIPPLYSRWQEGDRKRIDVLGPLYRWRENDVYRRLQILPNIYYTARTSPEDMRSWFFTFFPLLFVGNDDFLVFPVGGVARGLLGLDELVMVTPLYVRSRIGDLKTHHVLFPLIAWGSDGKPGGRRRFRIAPFYGRTVGRGGETRGFILWPFYTWRKKGEERAFFFFPFYGVNEKPTSKETVILFPFWNDRIDYLTGERDRALWPFWRRASGANGLDISRFWPLYEHRRVGFTTTRFVAWPLWRRQHVDDGRVFSKITWVPPFVKHVERYTRSDRSSLRKTLLWPLARWERRSSGAREFAFPWIVPFDSPALRETFAGWAPYVTLYRRNETPAGDTHTAALFGLVQGRRTAQERSFNLSLLYQRTFTVHGKGKVHLLGGLLGWERDPKGRYLRLLWGLRIRIGGAP